MPSCYKKRGGDRGGATNIHKRKLSSGSCGKTYYLTQKIPVIVVYCPKCTNQHVECKYETHEGNETPV